MRNSSVDSKDTHGSGMTPGDHSRTYTPNLYAIVKNITTCQSRDVSLEEMIRKSSIEALEKLSEQEYNTLYEYGYVYIPRILLSVEEYIKLRPATKAVLIWLMAKARIIEQKVNLEINDDETRNYPAVIAKNKEIAFYAGIRGEKNVSQYIAELEKAGFIRKRVKTIGGKKASLYQLRTIPMDKSGYIKYPMKVLITPAYRQLSNNARALYVIMVSESCSAKARSKAYFPSFNIAYSQIEKYGFSSATIVNCIQELKKYRFISVHQGEYKADLKRREMSTYSLTTGFLDLF